LVEPFSPSGVLRVFVSSGTRFIVLDPDETLYARVREGDMRAFDVLYARYETRLFGFLLSLLASRQDAEDVFHEAFLRTLKSGEVKFEPGGFRTWLYRIARNVALNRKRSDKRGARAMERLPEIEATVNDRAADSLLEERQMLVALDEALSRLPPAMGELYHLRSSGLSYEEMAAVLEVPLGTLKSRMHHMVQRLKEEMKPWTAR
jgi:RNA polymerase sigma-70 factor (ECF subfamily)